MSNSALPASSPARTYSPTGDATGPETLLYPEPYFEAPETYREPLCSPESTPPGRRRLRAIARLRIMPAAISVIRAANRTGVLTVGRFEPQFGLESITTRVVPFDRRRTRLMGLTP